MVNIQKEGSLAELTNNLDVSIILPTYNEADNIKNIIVEVSRVLNDNGIKGEIIIIDDDSADGTAVIAENLSDQYPVRTNVRKTLRGLATAVIKGFELARGDVCLVMDADLSHPVEKVADMVNPILRGDCDMTVGCRYMAGGGCKEWPLLRKIISKGSGLLARGLTRLSDPTSGFMAVKKSLVTDAKLDPIGWKIVLETVVKLRPRFIEIPIVFADRQHGESKLNLEAQLDYLRHLWRLYCYRYSSMIQFVKFCIVGFSGLVIDTITLVILVELLALDPRIAAIFAFLLVITWNYSLNRIWTFNRFNHTLYSYITFLLICCVGLGIRIGVMHLLLEYAGMHTGKLYILASIIGIFSATTSNFLWSKSISFSDRK